MHFLVTAPSTGVPLLDWFTRAGAVGVLMWVVIAFQKDWIVSGSMYRQALKERDRALDLVYQQADLTSRALEVTEVVKGAK